MGWYLRKSLNLGPIRINLSKSGIGASAGIKGLRVGTGPRGRYLHAGREGLYYRASLDPGSQQEAGVAAEDDVDAGSAANEDNTDSKLAEARWARITARSKALRDDQSDGENFKGGFITAFLAGLFGGLIRGR